MLKLITVLKTRNAIGFLLAKCVGGYKWEPVINSLTYNYIESRSSKEKVEQNNRNILLPSSSSYKQIVVLYFQTI